MVTGTTEWGIFGNYEEYNPIATKTENNFIETNIVKMKNVKLNDNYYLVSKPVNSDVTVEVAKKTNHIFVVDVSYSMYNDLSKIRTQLKNKLSNLMKEGDTISIVWFSGKHDSGILKEEVEVKSLKTLSDLNDAIDKWLRPVGMTAFLKPLQLVGDLIKRIKVNRPDTVFSMIFLTDGYNNDCPWGDVTNTLKSLENDIASSTFVEYGYYADSRKITEMAGILGGEKVSCDGFDDFEPVFDAKISSTAMGGKKTLVELNSNHLYDFAFSVDNGSVLLYNIVNGEILVGSNVKELYFFSKLPIGANEPLSQAALYGAIYILSDKLMNDDAEKVFYALGDNHYYKMLVNAYGKQKLNSFKAAIKECITDASKRFPEGCTKIMPVSDNAYCFMNLINDLINLDDCVFYPNHYSFNYKRIGRKKVSAATVLTETEKKKLATATSLEEIKALTKELEESKVDVTFRKLNPDKGYPLTDLVWNSTRANLSVRTYIEGVASLPKNEFGVDEVASFTYRTYTLVKDGIVNVELLPLNYSVELVALLQANNVKFTVEPYSNGEHSMVTVAPDVVVVDLTSIPVINRGMVKSVSAKALAELEWELVKLQGDKKVYDFHRKQLFPKTSKSFAELLGQDVADWLKEVGITDYNGFAPKVTSAEANDMYMSVNLDTKIKGLSSLPKVEVVAEKIKDNKPLKLNEWVMADAIKKYVSQTESDMYQSLSQEQQEGVLRTYLTTKTDILNKKKRKIMQEIAEIKFSLILSKKWFNEFDSFDENTLSLTLDGQKVDFTFDLSEKEEKV